MKKCEVCEVLTIDQDVIFETKFWRVSLDRSDQYYLGRSFVTVKRHTGDLAELTSTEWLDLQEVISKYETAVRSVFGAIVFNWSCLTNNAFQTKPYNPHIHWHVRPRYDKVVEVGSQVFTDNEFGHHYARSTSLGVSGDVAAAIIKKIKGNL
ncbi:MAG: HIT family protein [Patescibacteria group bacterium]